MKTKFARRMLRLSLLATCAALAAFPAAAQTSSVYGPYNADLPRGGDGLAKPLAGSPLPAEGPWSLQGWIAPATASVGRVVVAGVGDPASGGRFIGLEDGAPAVWAGGAAVKGATALKPGSWSHVAAVSDGTTVTLYVDGAKAGEGRPRRSARPPPSSWVRASWPGRRRSAARWRASRPRARP